MKLYRNNVNKNDFVLKNKDDWITESFKDMIPEPKIVRIQCIAPPHLQILLNNKGLITKDITNMINAGDIDGAISKIGCGIKSEDGIIRAITNKTQNTIDRLEKAVENEEKQQKILIKIRRY